jgi:hypothetical protein
MEDRENSFLDTIRELKHREPFVPFFLVTTSGDRYPIENPDNLAMGKTELSYYFPGSDRFVHLRSNQLVAVERLEERKSKRKAG